MFDFITDQMGNYKPKVAIMISDSSDGSNIQQKQPTNPKFINPTPKFTNQSESQNEERRFILFETKEGINSKPKIRKNSNTPSMMDSVDNPCNIYEFHL